MLSPIQLSSVILTTLADLAERDDQPYPIGVMYAGLVGKCDIHVFTAACDMLFRAGFVKNTGHHTFQITAEGKRVAAEVDAALKKRAEQA